MTATNRRRIGLAMMLAVPAGAISGSAHAASFVEAVVPASIATHAASYRGAVPTHRQVQLSVSLPLRNQVELTQLLAAQRDPASPLYRNYLSVAEFTERFGPTKADYAQAAAFFTQNGLQVRADAANRFMLQISGSADRIGQVFHVKLGVYQHPTEQRQFMAPDREPTLDLAVPVLSVSGLDDEQLPQPRLIRPGAILTTPRATGSGPNGEFIGSDMRAAYYGAGTLTGAGQSLGLMELVGYNLQSVQTYFSTVKQTLNVPVVTVATDGVKTSCTGTCDDSEQALDIEYAISMAPGLSKLQVYVGTPEDVLNRMASDNTSKQLSTSWGWKENFATDDALFQEMAAQGQTMLTASGDYSTLKASGPWPEEDANIVSVGGTDLVTNGAGGTWAGETGWKDSAGGPSVDKTIKIEPYQSGYVTTANMASSTLRNVPDIAASSNINMFYCANGGCSYAGGTSFASPLWAGFVALANQQATSLGKPVVGFINPTVYALGKTKSGKTMFHDQLRGKSGLYTCTPSFDLVTGLGSPKASLIAGLIGP